MPKYQWGARQSVVCFCFVWPSHLQMWMQHLQSSRTTCTKTASAWPSAFVLCQPSPAEARGEEQSPVCNSTWEWGGLQACCSWAVSTSQLLLMPYSTLWGVCVSVFLWCFPFCKANPAGWEATFSITAACCCCKWSLSISFQKIKIFLFAQQAGAKSQVLQRSLEAGDGCVVPSYSSFVCCFTDLSRAKGTRNKAPHTVKQISAPASQ